MKLMFANYKKPISWQSLNCFDDGLTKLKRSSEIKPPDNARTKLNFKMKNKTQKVPPILVVKVAFSWCVLPTNETETYPPKKTQWGQGFCEIAISKLDVYDFLKYFMFW